MTNSITLIAPSGAGKTTNGKLLANEFGYNFIDFDDDILEKIDSKTAKDFLEKYNIENIEADDLVGKPVSELLEKLGEENFKKLEEFMTLNLDLEKNNILATSGSQIYSELAMQTLQKVSDIIYLEIPLEEITKRLTNMKLDRIIGMNGKNDPETYKKVMQERIGLYERYSKHKFNVKSTTLYKLNPYGSIKKNKNGINFLGDDVKKIKDKERSINFNFEEFKKFLIEKGIIKGV